MAEKLRIVPPGGLGEVGKNMLSIEYGRNILVVDAGIMFPESDMLGIDYIIPDWGYLREKKEFVRAIVITHGHEDHIGGLSHFLEEFNVPVYATRLTQGLIEVKLKQKHMLKQARLNILDTMAEAIPYPRSELSRYAPRIFSMAIDKEKIGTVIGPGGKMIRKIEEDYGVEIDIQDDGTIFIAATDEAGASGARDFITDLTREIEVGEEFTAMVVKTAPFGAFAELTPGKEGLIHISELAWEHVRETEDVVKMGDEVRVKVIEVSDDGKIRLSRKALMERSASARSDSGGSRGGSRGGSGGGRSRGGSGPRRDSRSRPPRRDSKPARDDTDRDEPGANAYLREPRKR